jgi:MFS family permease
MRSRNIPILGLSQVLCVSGVALLSLLGGLIGADLSPSPAWVTLPVSLVTVGVASSTIPAALLMGKIGRRAGFVASASLACLASLLAAYAVYQRSFVLFCIASFLIGINGAFAQQYRFAAAESVEAEHSARAVSLVLVGGIVAGFLGPELAKWTKDWLPAGLYTGSFVSVAALYATATIFLSFLRDARPAATGTTSAGRPLQEIVIQPTYLLALLAGAVAYGVMTFTMTSTPIYMRNMQGFSLDETAWVIQSHIMAMYLPSLFTGFLLERLGIVRIMLAGCLALFTSVGLALVSHDLLHFWGTLVLLGIGWNFLFVGGTVLLTRSYRPEERFKAQAANDFSIFFMQAFTSLSAGTVLFYANWETLNLINLPFILLTLAVLIVFRRQIATEPAAS